MTEETVAPPAELIDDSDKGAVVPTEPPAQVVETQPETNYEVITREAARANELRMVTHTALVREGTRLKQEHKKGKTYSPGEKVAYSYYELATQLTRPEGYSESMDVTYNTDDPEFQPLRVSQNPDNGSWSGASKEGKVVRKITAKKNVGGVVMLTCEIEGKSEEVDIPASALLDAQLLSEEAKFSQVFDQESAEGKVIQARIAMLKNGALPPDTIDSSILEAGVRSGQITTDTMKAYINKILPEIKPAYGKPLTAEQQEQNAKRQLLLKRLENKSIASADDITTIFRETFTPEIFTEQKARMLARIRELESLAKSTEASEQELGSLREHVRLLEELQVQGMNPEPIIKKFFQKIERGDMPVARIMDIKHFFQTGDQRQIFETLAEDYKDNPEAMAEINKFRSFLESIGGDKALMVGGGLALIMLIMALKGLETQTQQH